MKAVYFTRHVERESAGSWPASFTSGIYVPKSGIVFFHQTIYDCVSDGVLSVTSNESVLKELRAFDEGFTPQEPGVEYSGMLIDLPDDRLRELAERTEWEKSDPSGIKPKTRQEISDLISEGYGMQEPLSLVA